MAHLEGQVLRARPVIDDLLGSGGACEDDGHCDGAHLGGCRAGAALQHFMCLLGRQGSQGPAMAARAAITAAAAWPSCGSQAVKHAPLVVGGGGGGEGVAVDAGGGGEAVTTMPVDAGGGGEGEGVAVCAEQALATACTCSSGATSGATHLRRGGRLRRKAMCVCVCCAMTG